MSRKEVRYFKTLGRWPGIPSRLAALVALSVTGAFFEGAGVGFLVPIVEALQSGGNPGGQNQVSRFLKTVFEVFGLPFTFLNVLAVGLALFFCQALLGYTRVMLTARTWQRFMKDMRTRLFANLIDFDLAFLHRSRIGELINTLVTETYWGSYSIKAVADMLSAVALLTAYAVMQVFVSWKLMLVTYPALGLLAFLLRPRQTYQMGVEQTKQNENLHSIAVESLGGIREIKALGLGPMTEGRFHGTATALEGLDVFFARAAARFSLVYQLVVLVLMISMVYIASRWARLSLPSLLVFIVVLQRMTPRVHAFIDNRHLWLGYMNALEKVEGMIGETSRTRSRVVSGPEAFGRLERAVELRELTFRHEGRAEDALDRVSFSIPRGKTVAIVGPSGAGKSTLLDLLARFYDPSAGAILVDGRELREFDLASWRGALGLVSQDTFLFNDSIEANIRYGDPRASREAVVRAAERAYAHSFISELPEKYATVVGDKGVKLSGGQRQRIALARAMLREPQLLLLDEATSHLDSESEMYVQRAIREFQKSATVVIVAHRLSTVEQADSIVVLDGGRVVEQGWHAELLARQGRYAELYRRQFKEPAEARG